MNNWRSIDTAPLETMVETKIDDKQGVRNVGPLYATQRDPSCRVMWWVPDGSMYVYYTPTHWRPLESPNDNRP